MLSGSAVAEITHGRGVRMIGVGPEELGACDPHGLLFVNVNTPHDYALAQRLADRHAGNAAPIN